MAPSRTINFAVVPVSTSTTSATQSHAVSFMLSLQVSLTVTPAPVPVSPVVSLISAAVKCLLLRLVHGLFGYPDVQYYQIAIVSLHRRM